MPTAAIVSAAGGMTDALVSIINTSLVASAMVTNGNGKHLEVDLHGFTWKLHGFTWIQWKLSGFTWIYMDLHGINGNYMDLMEFIYHYPLVNIQKTSNNYGKSQFLMGKSNY